MDAEAATAVTPAAAASRPGRMRRPLVGPFTGRHLLALGATLAAATLVLAVVTSPIAVPVATALPRPGSDAVEVAPPVAGLGVGSLAPEFTGMVDGQTVGLADLDGDPIRLSDLRGRPVWINFWASWCPPCQEETPILREVFETHREQGLAVVAISVQEASVEDVRAYAETYELDYTIGFDATSAIFKTYQAYALPTQIFLDADGVVRAVVIGPLTKLEVERILAPLLSSASQKRETNL